MAYDRNAKAREKGFANYYQYRKVVEYANHGPNRTEFHRTVGGGAGGSRGENLDLALLYYQAFKLGDPDDYSLQTRNGRPIVRIVNGVPKGAKAKWLIEIAQYVVDGAEWAERYPKGVRE